MYDDRNITGKYVLREGKPVEEPDLFKWGEWMEHSVERRIDETMIGNFRISTVFLGLDHNFSRPFPVPDGYQPIIFETMIFNMIDKSKYHRTREEFEDFCERYTTHEAALEGHRRAVKMVKDFLSASEEGI